MRRILVLLMAAMSLSAAAAEPRPFTVESPAAIRAAHRGKPFVLAFWSIHCEPCIREMPLWREMRRKYPHVPVLLVATDSPGERERVTRFLTRHDPGSVERWWYDGEVEERLRFAVDPKWRGELPRTYFYDSAHKVEVRTGVPSRTELEAWFVRVSAAR